MTWRGAGACVLGLLLLACDPPKADDVRPELLRVRAANEAMASRVDALERSRDALDRRVACLEAYRKVLATWRDHAGATQAIAEAPCVPAGKICPETGLPPGTIATYSSEVSRIIAAIDVPGALDDARSALPDLPVPPVKNAQNDRMRETRLEAEKASAVFLRDCGDVLEASVESEGAPRVR